MLSGRRRLISPLRALRSRELMSEKPPNTDEIAQELWRLAGEGASVGNMLSLAKERSGGGSLVVMGAFRGAFDVPLGELKLLVDSWQGWSEMGQGRSSEDLEREHGAHIRAARRPEPLRTEWTRSEDGKGWISFRRGPA